MRETPLAWAGRAAFSFTVAATAYSAIAAALDTLRLSTASPIGRRATASQRDSTPGRIPSPSEPSTSATRPAGSASASVASPSPSSAKRQYARRANLVERARQIDDADPRHALQRARSGLGERPRFGRRVPVLRDQRGRPERRRAAQDRADVVGIGHLIEHEQRAVPHQGFVQPPLLERRAVEHQPLMRRAGGDEPVQIAPVRQLDAQLIGQPIVERRPRLVRRPQNRSAPLGIGQRGLHRVPAPQPHLARARASARAALPPLAPAHRTPFLPPRHAVLLKSRH